MRNIQRWQIAFLATFLTMSASGQQAADLSWERYVRVLRLATLEWQESQPFTLRADFQLFDLEGHPADQGTLEETWGNAASPQSVVYSSPVMTPNGKAHQPPHRRESYLLSQALASLVRPFPKAAQKDGFSMDELQRSIDGAEQPCLLISSMGVSTGVGYCTDLDNRIVAITGDLFTLRRMNFREFREHQVPMDIELAYEGRVALTAHVTEVDALPAVSQPTPASKPKLPVVVPAKTLTGRIIKKKEPKYPSAARKKKIEGRVILTALISKEGKITELEVLASPDPLLTKSSVDAVQQWTYQPYLLNGVATEVERTITVTYSLNAN